MQQILILFLLLFPFFTYANQKTATWSVTYYDAIPTKSGIAQEYCRAHTLGTFIGNVNDQLKFGTTTTNGIFLDQFTFNASNKDGLYFMQGSLRARGNYQGKPWEDSIKYHCFKLSEYGLTHGIWTSKECKGFFIGKVVNP